MFVQFIIWIKLHLALTTFQRKLRWFSHLNQFFVQNLIKVCFCDFLIKFCALQIFWFSWSFQNFIVRFVFIILVVIIINRWILVFKKLIFVVLRVVIVEAYCLRFILIINFWFLKLFILSRLLWFRLSVFWIRRWHYDFRKISKIIIDLLNSRILLRKKLLLIIRFLIISIELFLKISILNVIVLIWVLMRFSIIELIEKLIFLIFLLISVIVSLLIEKFKTIVIKSDVQIEQK